MKINEAAELIINNNQARLHSDNWQKDKNCCNNNIFITNDKNLLQKRIKRWIYIRKTFYRHYKQQYTSMCYEVTGLGRPSAFNIKQETGLILSLYKRGVFTYVAYINASALISSISMNRVKITYALFPLENTWANFYSKPFIFILFYRVQLIQPFNAGICVTDGNLVIS